MLILYITWWCAESKPDSSAAQVWSLSANDMADDDVELIDDDDLLDEDDLIKPDPASLRGNVWIQACDILKEIEEEEDEEDLLFILCTIQFSLNNVHFT